MLYLVALLVVALDQWIKWMIATHLAVNQAIVLWPGVLELMYVQNHGAAFSILVDQRVFLIVVSLLVIVAIVYFRRRYVTKGVSLQVALGLLLGGTVGNLIDRVRLGYVVDYVYVQIIHYPVFNLADSAIVISILYLLLRFIRRDAGSERRKPE